MKRIWLLLCVVLVSALASADGVPPPVVPPGKRDLTHMTAIVVPGAIPITGTVNGVEFTTLYFVQHGPGALIEVWVPVNSIPGGFGSEGFEPSEPESFQLYKVLGSIDPIACNVVPDVQR